MRTLATAFVLSSLSVAINAAPTIRAQTPNLRTARIFSDGMVLQRERPIAIWGWAAPRADISGRLEREVRRTRADASGAWRLTFAPRHAGGPYRVKFAAKLAAATDSIVLSNVLIGDVWVASGQSNMEFPVANAANARAAIAAANDSTIREFKVPTSWANAPEPELAGGSWSPADPEHVGRMSAVAYFYARHLRPSVSVPIGIINTTWGGSNIETWLSRGAQHLTDSAWAAIRERESASDRAVRDSLRGRLGTLPEVDSGLVAGVARWADPALDDRAWSDIRVPAYWEPQGYPAMDGVAWYRTTVMLDSSDISKGVTLSVAAIDDDDITWMNGIEIGRTNGYNVPRSYRIPPNALHAGANVLTVRVFDSGGGGGINGTTSLTFGDGTRRSLAGVWKFRVGRVTLGTDGQRINKIPTVLYNKMVYPLLPLAIKGVLWYQGESNANNAAQAAAYREQFASLVTSWRREWTGGGGKFPFLWVQLPGFGRPDSVPPLSPAWAIQRESMDAALRFPKTGRAIAIDLGEADDIHPKNKEDVGARLALVGRFVAYDESVDASGPVYRAFTMRGDTAVISFTHAGGGLSARGTELGGFALAGNDRHFVWASAKIVGNRVFVWSDRVRAPVAVRYAWANNPDRANLYGKNGLPAAPFRSDRW